MNKAELNRWLSLAANVGVLLGVVILIAEVKQNRDLARAELRHELTMDLVEILHLPAVDAAFADLLLRANAGEPLTETDAFRFQLRANAVFRYWEGMHYQYRSGLYDADEFAKQREGWRAALAQSAGYRSYWCTVRTLYSPEFVIEIDGLLSGGPC